VDFAHSALDIVEKLVVVAFVAFLLTHSGLFPGIARRALKPLHYLVLIVGLGVLAIYGTYSGIVLPSEAIANIRDTFPMIAGFVGGPIIGLGAGIIGGLHRYFAIGGTTGLPCAIATGLAGLLGGLLFYWRRKPTLRVWATMLFAAVMEGIHMGLILLLVDPYDKAANAVEGIYVYMVVGNVLAVLVFTLVFNWAVKRLKETDSAEATAGG
jgi:sigma-B regulation protein RsbU (phosphoserine phosphatase)